MDREPTIAVSAPSSEVVPTRQRRSPPTPPPRPSDRPVGTGERASMLRPLPKPVRVGKYVRVARLGGGGMAEVYLAVEHGELGQRRLVVHKVPRAEFAKDPEYRTMLADEARLGALVRHPGCAATLEGFIVGEEQVLVLEHVDGWTLGQLGAAQRERARWLPLPVFASLVLQMLDALAYLHELRDIDGRPLQALHRDVSPSNLIVGWDGRLKLIDFGVAKSVTNRYVTLPGHVRGKIAYASPEALRGERQDARSDVFSASVVAWELASLRRAFHGETPADVMRKVLEGKLPHLADCTRLVPREVGDVIARGLGPREERFASTREMATALREALALRGVRDLGAHVVASYFERHYAKEREARAAEIEQVVAVARHAPTSTHALVAPTAVESSPASAPRSVTSVDVRARALAAAALAAFAMLLLVSQGVALGMLGELRARASATAPVHLEVARALPVSTTHAATAMPAEPASTPAPAAGPSSAAIEARSSAAPELAEARAETDARESRATVLGSRATTELLDASAVPPTAGARRAAPSGPSRGQRRTSSSPAASRTSHVASGRASDADSRAPRAESEQDELARWRAETLARARARYRAGDYAAAENAYLELARRSPDVSVAIGLGNARAMRGDFDGAARAFSRALAMDPTNETARALLARAESRRGGG